MVNISMKSIYLFLTCLSVTFPTAPHTEIMEKGEIVYSEVNRENVRKLEAYAEEMASANQISGLVNIQKIQDDVVKLWNVVKSQAEISEEQKNRIKALYDGVVRSLRTAPDNCLVSLVVVIYHPSSCSLRFQALPLCLLTGFLSFISSIASVPSGSIVLI